MPATGRLAIAGSSPHTRGAPSRHRWQIPTKRIIPAYAGSTPDAGPRPHTLGDHPRIRGEHRTQFPGVQVAVGSSPHTRGAQKHLDRPVDARGIIPAYAGSTRACSCQPSHIRDHPRIRGEHSIEY